LGIDCSCSYRLASAICLKKEDDGQAFHSSALNQDKLSKLFFFRAIFCTGCRGQLAGLCAIIYLGISSHFFIKEGFSRQSFKNFFVDGKRTELLAWIALFIENYPMV
jgi:hypothetical protein